MGVELLISEIIGNVLDNPIPHKTCHIYFYFLNIMVSTTQTLSQIKPQQFIGHIHKHFITTSPLAYVTNGI